VRAYQETRSPLTLNLPYYAARKGEGFALTPWDRYMEEAEDLLQGLGEGGSDKLGLWRSALPR
jgi:hypothetical protein